MLIPVTIILPDPPRSYVNVRVTDAITCANDSAQVNGVTAIVQLWNDTRNGEPLESYPDTEVTIVTPPAQGTAVINSNKELVFTPPAGFSGQVTVRYKAKLLQEEDP